MDLFSDTIQVGARRLPWDPAQVSDVDAEFLFDYATKAFALKYARKRSVLSSWSAVQTYVQLKLGNLGREEFHVLFLDTKNRLIADECMGVGTIDHAPVYPREVCRRALELDAAHLILAHNHPSGDPSPSSADIEMTRQVIEAARIFGIKVHDHVVVGRDGVASLKSLGMI